MEEEQKKKIALFRFGVISELVGRKSWVRGEREKVIGELVAKEWEIPGSGRTRISRSVIWEWLRLYERSGRKIESLLQFLILSLKRRCHRQKAFDSIY